MTAEEQRSCMQASSPPLPSFLHLHTRPKQIHFQHLREGETRYLSPSLSSSLKVIESNPEQVKLFGNSERKYAQTWKGGLVTTVIISKKRENSCVIW